MNGYNVAYYPGGTSVAASLHVEAKTFMIEGEYLLFLDEKDKAILAVPLNLDPVVLRTSVDDPDETATEATA